jgi:hypothetical protein
VFSCCSRSTWLSKEDPEQRVLWESISVIRGTAELGTLKDLRLTLQYLMIEKDLQSQLNFSRKRTRSTPKAVTQAELHMTDYRGLYLKVKHTNVRTLNQNLLINLGTEYNQELSSIAESEYDVRQKA